MSYPFSADLQKHIQSRLSAGGYPSEEEDLQAVREAIDEWRAGDDGLPLKDAFNEIRAGR